jgi:group I intron endonuclease
MYYLVYKVTNHVNDKIYIGVHKTEDKNDGYIGSGKVLKRAIEKYGVEHFTKEILYECGSEEEMLQKEADIVDEEFVKRKDTYNIKCGGFGGWDYVNRNGLGLRCGSFLSEETRKKISDSCMGRSVSEETRKKISDANRNKIISEETKRRMSESHKKSCRVSPETREKISNSLKGKKHTDETKRKMSNSRKGKPHTEEWKSNISKGLKRMYKMKTNL